MKFFVNLAQMCVGDVSVDLSGADVGVAEHGLDGAEVGTVHEKVGGKGMAQSVRRHMFRDAGEASVFFDNSFYASCGDAAVVTRIRWGAFVFGVIQEKRRQRIGASV